MPRILILLACALWFVFVPVAARAQGQPKFRVGVSADGDDGLGDELMSLLSREVRKLDSIIVTDTAPQYKLSAMVIPAKTRNNARLGYIASLVVMTGDDHFIGQSVFIDTTLESLAHKLALSADANVFEKARRAQAGAEK